MCEGSPASGLQVGGQARVQVQDEGLKLRAGPGTNFRIIENLPSGTTVTILDGPQAAAGYVWWKIRASDGNEGWSVEGADGITTLVPANSQTLVSNREIYVVNDPSPWAVIMDTNGDGRIYDAKMGVYIAGEARFLGYDESTAASNYELNVNGIHYDLTYMFYNPGVSEGELYISRFADGSLNGPQWTINVSVEAYYKNDLGITGISEAQERPQGCETLQNLNISVARNDQSPASPAASGITGLPIGQNRERNTITVSDVRTTSPLRPAASQQLFTADISGGLLIGLLLFRVGKHASGWMRHVVGQAKKRNTSIRCGM